MHYCDKMTFTDALKEENREHQLVRMFSLFFANKHIALVYEKSENFCPR